MFGGLGIIALCVGAFAVWEATEEFHELIRWAGRRLVRAPAMIGAAALWLVATILLIPFRVLGQVPNDGGSRRDARD